MEVYRRTSYKEFVLRVTFAGHEPRLLKTDFLFLISKTGPLCGGIQFWIADF